jgi:hypothetical protein
LKPTPADSLDFEGDSAAIFGTSMHKVKLSKEAQQRIKNSKGYLTQKGLSDFVKKHPEFKGIFEEAGGSLHNVPWNSGLIQSLIKEGYVGFNNKRYGEVTNWLVGTPGFDLEATPYASGGIVKGPGTGTSDSIPAMLSSGEAVIPAKAVRENPKLVDGLIAGNIPGYAKGGMIGPKRKLTKYSPKTGAIGYYTADEVEQSMSDSKFREYEAAKKSGNGLKANTIYRQAEMYLSIEKSGKNKINFSSEEEEIQMGKDMAARFKEQGRIAKNKMQKNTKEHNHKQIRSTRRGSTTKNKGRITKKNNDKQTKNT